MMEDPNPCLSTMQRLQGSMRGYVFLDDGSLYTLTNIIVNSIFEWYNSAIFLSLTVSCINYC